MRKSAKINKCIVFLENIICPENGVQDSHVLTHRLGPISNLVYTDVIDIRSWLAVCLHYTSVPLAVTAVELRAIFEYVLLYVIHP